MISDKLFGESSDNDDIFEEVAAPIIEGCLAGINGTIFAYGQTSSGKDVFYKTGLWIYTYLNFR